MLVTLAVVAGCSPAAVTAPPAEPAPPVPVVAEVDAPAAADGPGSSPVVATDPHLRCSDPSLWVCVE